MGKSPLHTVPIDPAQLTRAERRKLETAARLRDAAFKLFLARGYEEVTTADIAAEADLGAGTFYLHFTDKRDIFVAIGNRAVAEVMQRWRGALRSGMSIAEIVNAMVDVATEFWHESPERTRLLLEGGPNIEARAYVEVANTAATALAEAAPGRTGDTDIEVLANLVVALAFQIGRLIIASEPARAAMIVEGTRKLIARALS